MRQVRFTQMRDGTREEFLLLQGLEGRHLAGTAGRVLRELGRQGDEAFAGYRISRLDHALQSATRALRDSADDDWVVAALLHDLGDGLAPCNHDRFAAEVLRPYVREECSWVVGHHGQFQMYYYAHHDGRDRHAREAHRDHPCFASACAFCERWDQRSFDPDYEALPLSAFAALLERVFARPAYAAEVLRPGQVDGLPPAGGPGR